MHHVAKQKLSRTGFMNMTIRTLLVFPVTRPESRRTSLECSKTGDSEHEITCKNQKKLCDAIISV